MTGFDVAAYFREHYSQLPPLVALTANVLKNKQEYYEKGMDEAISKPLSLTAVQEVLSLVSDGDTKPQPKVVSNTQESDNTEVFQRLLDLEMLESYVGIVGTKPVYDSVEMFEDMMPDYIELLDSNMTAKDQEGIVSEAHKIKGAAGSIGLKHIQSVAQKAQSPNLPAWWENIDDWVEEIKNEYLHDIKVLKDWLGTVKSS